MKITSKTDAPLVDGVTGFEAKKMFENDRLDMIHLRLKKEEHIPAHALPIDVIFFVIGGNGLAEIDGKEYYCQQGTLVQVDAGQERGWHNVNSADLEILVVKMTGK